MVTALGFVLIETSRVELGSAGRGNPDGYQKKGVAGEAKRIVVKTGELVKRGQIGAGKQRRDGKQAGTRPQNSQETITQVSYKVNKIIYRLRSNAIWPEVAKG